MKKCYKCENTRPLEDFHKNKGMKDERLNLCKPCHKEQGKQSRLRNPDCRKQEHARNRNKKGFLTREEWKKEMASKKLGKKAVAIKYAHKRHTRTKIKDELTDFVMEEAAKLCKMRQNITGFAWHIDHIVPINHKLACGLHLYTNLQVVPAEWNLRKKHLNMDTYWNG